MLTKPKRETIQTDLLIIGGGAAGCKAAIGAKEQGNLDVTVLAFGDRLVSEVDLDEIRADLLSVVAEVLQPRSVSLCLVKRPAEGEVRADQDAQDGEILM